MTAASRPLRSLLLRLARSAAWRLRVLRLKVFAAGVQVPWSARIGPGCLVQATNGARIEIGDDVEVGGHSQLVADVGAIVIGARSFIGRGCSIVAQESVWLGEDVLVAEGVTIRDQDHRTDAGDPIMRAGFVTAPVRIGDGAWLAAKATILRGTHIGAGAVVAAHAVVREDVPARAIAGGIPARVLRHRDA